MALPPREQRHEWLRFNTQGYSEEEEKDYEIRLANIYYRKIHQIQVLDFARLSEINKGDGDLDMTERLRMQHRGDDGEVLFMTFIWRELLEEEMQTEGFRAYWEAGLRRIATKAYLINYWTMNASEGDFLGLPPSYTLIREPLRRLCHRLITFTISSRGMLGRERSEVAEGPPREQVVDVGRGAHIDPEVPQDAPVDQEDDQPGLAPQQTP
ncbi:hypothetical protein Tco_0854331 [Tanacetum coccineum]